MSIKVNNISKKIGQKTIISKINFEANPGDIVGILGPNGAGKSTIMKTITGLYTQTSGDIYICDKETVSNRIFTQSKIGYLSEENPLYKDMYVIEFLEFICDIHKIKYHNCNPIMELAGLKKVKNQKINTLSKGFKQRVGIAQALIHNPDVIILDEPTSGLDPQQLIEIRNIITNLGRDKTILLSTHIIQEIEAMCNRIIIVNKGKLLANKKIEKFNNNIMNEFLQLIK